MFHTLAQGRGGSCSGNGLTWNRITRSREWALEQGQERGFLLLAAGGAREGGKVFPVVLVDLFGKRMISLSWLAIQSGMRRSTSLVCAGKKEAGVAGTFSLVGDGVLGSLTCAETPLLPLPSPGSLFHQAPQVGETL